MEKSEPTLVPEWLKSSGSVTGVVSTNHYNSSLHQDNHTTLKAARNKSLVNISDHDLGHRTTSAYFRRSSSNGTSHLRSYGSFGRNNRDRDWDKDFFDNRDKEKSNLGDRRHRQFSDSFESNLSSRFEKDGLRRTQSTISRTGTEPWPRKVPSDLKNIGKSNHNNGNSRLAVSSPISSVHKASFDRDFPSLGAEERQKDPEIGRVPSPGMGTAIQNLPTGSSAGIVDGGWTSALAEVPAMIGSNGTTASSVPHAVPSSASAALSMTTGLNMAETLVQGPPRVQADPQLSVETQRLEELAIKQSRQLIPVTPSMPKALVLNPSDKTKGKLGLQQQSTSTNLVHHSPRGAPTKSDISKTSSLGKLQVLKPARERNGVSNAAKDTLSPTSSSKQANNPLTPALATVGSAPLRSSVNNSIFVTAERKSAPPVLVTPILEKRPSPQAKSRNDFFNSMRKKSMANSSSTVSNPVPAVSPSDMGKHSEAEAAASPDSQGRDAPVVESSSGGKINECRDESIRSSYGPQKSLDNGVNHSSTDVILSSEEEEAAFLRSLGWEEDSGEDEGLTEEEINAFYRDVSKYINSVPSSKTFLGTKQKLFGPNFQMGNNGGVSSGVSSSDSKLDS